jgi:thiol-disulfide isomerase/thioredoxin
MIPRTAILAAALGISCAISPGVGSRPAAPQFHATTLDGERFTNESIKGKVVLIQFWTTWCGVCRYDQPQVDEIVREFSSKGLTVLAVSVGESKSKVRSYLAKSPRACKIVLTEDTNLASAFDIRGFPHYVLIDDQGRIAGEQRGGGADLRVLLAKAGLRAN